MLFQEFEIQLIDLNRIQMFFYELLRGFSQLSTGLVVVCAHLAKRQVQFESKATHEGFGSFVQVNGFDDFSTP